MATLGLDVAGCCEKIPEDYLSSLKLSRTETVTGGRFTAVTSWNDGVLAVGSDGLVVYLDRETITMVDAAIAVDMHDVESGSGVVHAVGDAGTLLTSEDGLTWAAMDVGTTADLHGITRFGNEEFVAVGDDVILVSTGMNWSPATGPDPAGPLRRVYPLTYNEFMSIGADNSIVVLDANTRTFVAVPSPLDGEVLSVRPFGGGIASLVIQRDGKAALADRVGSEWKVVPTEEPDRACRGAYLPLNWLTLCDDGSILLMDYSSMDSRSVARTDRFTHIVDAHEELDGATRSGDP